MPRSRLPNKIELVSNIGRCYSQPEILRVSDLLILEIEGMFVFVRETPDAVFV